MIDMPIVSGTVFGSGETITEWVSARHDVAVWSQTLTVDMWDNFRESWRKRPFPPGNIRVTSRHSTQGKCEY